jgi:hypothetical protein
MAARPALGGGTGAALGVVEQALAGLDADRSSARAQAAVRARLGEVARQAAA